MMIAANQPSDGGASRIRQQFLATGDALTALGSIAARIYVPESERSRVRGAGGGSVEEE